MKDRGKMYKFFGIGDSTLPPECVGCPRERVDWVGNRGSDDLGMKKIIFIGEAPGADEVRKRKPFVGRAGVVLNEWIGEMGVKSYLITNVIHCRPPSNRTPTSEEVEHCLVYLREGIYVNQPQLIVTLGRVARDALMDIDKPLLRSSLQEYDSEYGPIVVLPHPAYILRNPRWNELVVVWLREQRKAERFI